MKNPLYPTTLIDNTTIKNYNKCLIITPINTEYVIPSIFNEDVDENIFCPSLSIQYDIKQISMWMIRLIPEYNKKFVIFDITEDDLLKFKFSGEQIIYNLILKISFFQFLSLYYLHIYFLVNQF